MLKIRKLCKIFLFAVIFFIPCIVSSIYINPYNYEAAPIIDNSTSIFYNPAGIALMQDFNTYLNLSYVDSKNVNTSFAVNFLLGGFGYDNFNAGNKDYKIYHLAIPGYLNFYNQILYFGLSNKWYTINKSHPYTFGFGLLTRFFNHLSLGFVYDNLNKKKIHYDNRRDTIKNYSIGLGFFKNRLILSLDNLFSDKFNYNNNIYKVTWEPLLGLFVDFTYFNLRNDKKLLTGIKIKFPNYGFKYYNSNKYSQNSNYEFSYHSRTYKTFFSIRNKITEISVSGLLTDTEQFSFFGITSRGAQNILENLDKCYNDNTIKGIILNIGYIQTTSYGGIGGLVYEIRDKILQLRKKDKVVVAYLETGGSTEEYYLASAANVIVFSPYASLSELGVSVKVLKLTGLLDKIGASFEVIQSGKNKNALSPFTEDISLEQEEKIRASVEDSYNEFVESISKDRLIKLNGIKELIEESPILDAELLKENDWIDNIGYREKVNDEMARLLNRNRIYGYQETDVRRIEYYRKDWGKNSAIAVVSIYGPIMSGESVYNPLYGALATGSETIAKQLKEIEGDSLIKAVILRIDSPGGSLVASDRIYEAVKKLKKSGKYDVAYFGSMAASGSYYIACAADYIISTPFSVTGSIGVFSMKLELSELFKKLDITTTTVKKGKYVDLFSMDRKLTEDELTKLEQAMDKAHDRFKEVVSKGRGIEEDTIDDVADGSIYTGNQAKEIGLVDELGGMKKAAEHIELKLDLEDPDYIYYWSNIRSYSPIKLGTSIFNF